MDLVDSFFEFGFPVLWLLLVLVSLTIVRGPAKLLLAAAFGWHLCIPLFLRFGEQVEIPYETYDFVARWSRSGGFGAEVLLGIGIILLAKQGNTVQESDSTAGPTVTGRLNVPERINISQLRTRGERVMIWVLSLITAAVLLLVGIVVVEEPAFLLPLVLLVGAVLLMGWIGARVIRGSVLGNSIKVSGKQFPEIDEIKHDLMRRMSYKQPTEIYIVEAGTLNAFLARFIGTRYIVLNSGLVSAMLNGENKEELTFVIGRAIGHLKARHFRFWILQFLIAAEKLNPIFYLLYTRMVHYSGDRMGLVACGSPDSAVSALIKLTVGDKLRASVDEEQVFLQEKEVRSSIGAFIAEFSSTHPHLVKRITAVRRYANEGARAQVSREPGRLPAKDRTTSNSGSG